VQFNKAASVFRDWVDDSPKILAQAFKHDMTYWKIKSVVEDKADERRLADIFSHYFKDLKDIFLSAVAEAGSPPDMECRPFFSLC
jgi:hypothetical protein